MKYDTYIYLIEYERNFRQNTLVVPTINCGLTTVFYIPYIIRQNKVLYNSNKHDGGCALFKFV